MAQSIYDANPGEKKLYVRKCWFYMLTTPPYCTYPTDLLRMVFVHCRCDFVRFKEYCDIFVISDEKFVYHQNDETQELVNKKNRLVLKTTAIISPLFDFALNTILNKRSMSEYIAKYKNKGNIYEGDNETVGTQVMNDLNYCYCCCFKKYRCKTEFFFRKEGFYVKCANNNHVKCKACICKEIHAAKTQGGIFFCGEIFQNNGDDEEKVCSQGYNAPDIQKLFDKEDEDDQKFLEEYNEVKDRVPEEEEDGEGVEEDEEDNSEGDVVRRNKKDSGKKEKEEVNIIYSQAELNCLERGICIKCGGNVYPGMIKGRHHFICKNCPRTFPIPDSINNPNPFPPPQGYNSAFSSFSSGQLTQSTTHPRGNVWVYGGATNPNMNSDMNPFQLQQQQQQQQLRAYRDVTSNHPYTDTVGNYALGEKIGKGGSGTVYLARDIVNKGFGNEKKIVAVKSIAIEGDADQQKVFDSELRVGLHLNSKCPFLIAYKEVLRIPPQLQAKYGSGFFLVMEYCAGGDLADAIRTRKSQLPSKRHFSDEELLLFVYQVGRAVQTLHREGIVHRDLKPENILLNVHGKYRLGDFSIAREVDPLKKKTTFSAATIGYASPEFLNGDIKYSKEKDVYSFGCVLLELIDLCHPFQNEVGFLQQGRIFTGQANPPRTEPRLTPVAKGLRDFGLRMMSLNPSQRPSVDFLLQQPDVLAFVFEKLDHSIDG